MEMERGQVLQTDRTDMVSFYVKPAAGYVTPTTFEHRNGRSEAELAKARFEEGIYVDIADAPSIISTEHTSRDFRMQMRKQYPWAVPTSSITLTGMMLTNTGNLKFRQRLQRLR